MSYLAYLLHAKSHYSLHSPYLFGFYTQVLHSRIPHYAGIGKSLYDRTVWRIENFFHATKEVHEGYAHLVASDSEFLVINRPYKNPSLWQGYKDDTSWQVTIDMHHVGIVIRNSRLSKQHFVLF